MWRNQAAMVRRDKSFLNVSEPQVVKGPPTDAALQPLLAHPSGDRANQVYSKAVNTAFSGARGPNHTENDTWFTTVPNDFWN
jgi:hypothetical protein